MATKRVSQSNLQVKHDMYNALMVLLKDKELSKINVSDLTKEAKVSRMSFYRNYKSIEDILKDKLLEIVEEYRTEDLSIGVFESYFDINYIKHSLTFFKKKCNFIDILISSGMGDLFLSKITDYLSDKWNIEENSIDRYKISAFAGSLYNIYREWEYSEFKESPELIASCLAEMLK